jgi:hypothetical protein
MVSQFLTESGTWDMYLKLANEHKLLQSILKILNVREL